MTRLRYPSPMYSIWHEHEPHNIWQDAFADSLKSKILEPLSETIKQQKEERKKLQETAQDFVRRVNDAKADVKKTYQKYEEAFEKHAEYQSTAERYNATGRIKDYDKVLPKVRASKQKLDDATDRHEDAKVVLERVKSDIDRYESPKMMEKVREVESARMRGALTLVLELIDLERRRASMEEAYVAGMAQKLKQIDLSADDLHFYLVHIQDSLNLAHQPSKSGPLMSLGPASPMGLALPSVSCPTSPVKEKDLDATETSLYAAPPPRYTYDLDRPSSPAEDRAVYPVLDQSLSSPPAYCGSISSAKCMSSSFDQLSAAAYSTGNMRTAVYES